MAEPTTGPDQTTKTTSWGTLEELLLACAVNRYGTESWDSVARELQKRSFSFSLLTPPLCRQKFLDLRRRFAGEAAGGETAGAGTGDVTGAWLKELRRLRVAELRSELERYDLSIVSLQTKVKRLKEEREQSLEEGERENPPDLEREREGEVKTEPPEANGSNSPVREPEPGPETGSGPAEPGPEPDRANEPDGRTEPEGEGSSSSRRREKVESAESRGGGEGEERDVQSSGSRREKETGVVSGNTSGGEVSQLPGGKCGEGNGKLKPLAEFIEVVKGGKIGSVFERRLESQETARYKNLIRQHIDLVTIQRRLEGGQYAECHLKFYRDLKLLINNAIIFFSSKSPEHKAAVELRQLFTKQFQLHLSSLKKETPKHIPPKPPKTEPEKPDDQAVNLKPKLTVSGPLIACRKRSSIVAKSSVGGERKEPALAALSSGEKVSSSSLNAVTKKRPAEQSLGSRSSSSKNEKNNASVSAKGERESREGSETKAENRKKQSPTNSFDRVKHGLNSGDKGKHGSNSGDALLLDLLKNSAEKKRRNNSSGGNVKGEKRKDMGREKMRGAEVRERAVTRSSGRPPKRAAAMAATGKRSRQEPEAVSKKRQRK